MRKTNVSAVDYAGFARVKLNDSTSVRTWGAKGDGVTDDTAAIQACATANAGGTIYIPAGKYRLTSAVTISEGTLVRGDGRCGAAILAAGSTTEKASILTIEGLNCTALALGKWCTVSDLTLGFVGGIASTSGALVAMAYGCTVTRISAGRMTGAAAGSVNQAISAVGTVPAPLAYVRILDVAINNVGGAAIYFKNVVDGTISSVTYDSGDGSLGTGILLDTFVEGVAIHHVEVLHCASGLAFVGTAMLRTNCPAFNKVSASFFDLCTRGIYVQYGLGLSFADCWCSSHTEDGMRVDSAVDVQVIGGSFNYNGRDGFRMVTGSACLTVHGLTAIGNVSTGVHILAGVVDFLIQGNRLMGGAVIPGGPGAVTAVGVLVDAGASDRYVIADNIIRGCTTGVTDGGTGVNKRVANNY